jgi:hypothetical protein
MGEKVRLACFFMIHTFCGEIWRYAWESQLLPDDPLTFVALPGHKKSQPIMPQWVAANAT